MGNGNILKEPELLALLSFFHIKVQTEKATICMAYEGTEVLTSYPESNKSIPPVHS